MAENQFLMMTSWLSMVTILVMMVGLVMMVTILWMRYYCPLIAAFLWPSQRWLYPWQRGMDREHTVTPVRILGRRCTAPVGEALWQGAAPSGACTPPTAPARAAPGRNHSRELNFHSSERKWPRISGAHLGIFFTGWSRYWRFAFNVFRSSLAPILMSVPLLQGGSRSRGLWSGYGDPQPWDTTHSVPEVGCLQNHFIRIILWLNITVFTTPSVERKALVFTNLMMMNHLMTSNLLQPAPLLLPLVVSRLQLGGSTTTMSQPVVQLILITWAWAAYCAWRRMRVVVAYALLPHLSRVGATV